MSNDTTKVDLKLPLQTRKFSACKKTERSSDDFPEYREPTTAQWKLMEKSIPSYWRKEERILRDDFRRPFKILPSSFVSAVTVSHNALSFDFGSNSFHIEESHARFCEVWTSPSVPSSMTSSLGIFLKSWPNGCPIWRNDSCLCNFFSRRSRRVASGEL